MQNLSGLQRRFLTPLLSKKVPPVPEEHERPLYPEHTSNYLSQLYFAWLNPVLKVGYKRTLEQDDMFKLTDELKVENMTKEFHINFQSQAAKAKAKHIIEKCKQRGETTETTTTSPDDDLADFRVPKKAVLMALFLTFKVLYSTACIIVFFSSMAQCLTPLLTKELIKYVESRALGVETNAGKGVGYAIGTILMLLFGGLAINHGFFRGMMAGAQMRAVLSKSVLEKSFVLNSKSKHDYPTSKITSMMSTDTSRIDFAAAFQPFLITFPASLVVIIVILIVNIGVSALVGIGFLIIFLVAISVVSKKMFAMRANATKFTDLRVNYMKEVLNNLKIIKYYSWEEAYHKNISDVRGKEMKIIYFIQILRNFVTASALSLSIFSSLVAFLVLYAIGSSKRNAANIFSSISLFNVFTTMVFMIPLALSSLSDALIGIDRIGNFLAAPEATIEEGRVEASPETLKDMDDRDLSIQVTKATFEWETFAADEEEEKPLTKKEKKQMKKEQKLKDKQIKLKEKEAETIEVVSKTSDSADEKRTKVGSDAEDQVFDSEAFAGLNDLNLNIRKGEFIVITGLIGSGKSSLLNAIAGFMKKVEGSVDINGSMVLCGQPWIQNTTVKENIIFGSEYDEEKYKQVIYSCSLESDLEILPAGDRTEIGERGITLSGGQKARINLARAVYSDKDIVLMDDVLSAVDARVGKHIMENCMMGLLGKKTKILATHQLSLIGSADRIIFLNGDGSISVGTQEALLSSNPGFNNLMTFNTQAEEDDEEKEEEFEDEEIHEEEKEMIERQVTRGSTLHNKVSVIDEEAIHKEYNQDQEVSGKLTDDERKAVNGIGFGIYVKYVKLGQGIFKHGSIVFIILMLFTFSIFCTLFTNTWLSFWTEYRFPTRSNGFYIGIYVMFAILSFLMSLFAFIVLGYLTNQASKKLNVMAVEKVLYSPMSFLDTTPMGRIISRFTKDTDVLDNEIGDQMRFMLFSVANIFGVMILGIIYLPWFAIALPPFFFSVFMIAEYYQSSAREIKRLEALQRSFVYNNFNETLAGMDTIKAYDAGSRFLGKNDYYTNRMNEAYYLTIVSQRWVGVNLELATCVLPLVITLLSVFRVFDISAASVGLVTSYVIQITGQIAFLIRSYTQVEIEMNSAERLCEFAFDLDQERPYVIPETAPPADWPQAGGIEFKDVSMSYRPGLPYVLKNLNFSIKPQEKIGICGRTGAGKSSIMTALYRLSEMDEGDIEIDGVGISKLGLKDLRTKLSIIPQDPVLFRGSIRKNLDPFGQSSDTKLWDAMRRAGLIDGDKLQTVMNQGKHDENLYKFHLDQPVEDEGSNFSLGERQLIALARALVRDSKILILDEATSSVDYETDAKIQETIVREFSGCTILCIAHRLRTIINYDKILVLDRGELKEYDTPWNLFNLEDGIFHQMCQKSKIEAEDFTRK